MSERRDMPPWYYVPLHLEAKLSPQERELIGAGQDDLAVRALAVKDIDRSEGSDRARILVDPCFGSVCGDQGEPAVLVEDKCLMDTVEIDIGRRNGADAAGSGVLPVAL